MGGTGTPNLGTNHSPLGRAVSVALADPVVKQPAPADPVGVIQPWRYSGDGSRFAYEQQKCGTGANPSSDEQGAIAVASADGSGVKVIVPLGGVRTHPGGEIAWSPTDDVIAFGTQDGQLSLVASDGTGLRTVDLPQAGFAYGPTWSPDGKWIVVTVALQATGHDDLFVVSPDGLTMRQVTDTVEVEAFTDWGTAP